MKKPYTDRYYKRHRKQQITPILYVDEIEKRKKYMIDTEDIHYIIQK